MKTTSSKITIKTPDGACDAFVAYPSEGGPFPGVILGMDAFGVRPYLCEMTETLASKGYFVVTPNFFYRSKHAPVTDAKFPLKPEDFGPVIEQIRPLMASWTNEQKRSDAGALIEFLGQQKQVRPGKVGMTGYCMGGSFALRAAAWYPDQVGAVASFHAGGLVSDAPDSVHRLLPTMKAELYIAHADNDKSMPPEQIKAFDEALSKSGLRFESEVYTGAAHGFTMADGRFACLQRGCTRAALAKTERVFCSRALRKRNEGLAHGKRSYRKTHCS
jgi:carboxymethylenebutenolidase